MQEMMSYVDSFCKEIDINYRIPKPRYQDAVDYQLDANGQIIRLKIKMNNLLRINKVLNQCNRQLDTGGFLVGYFESLDQRRKRIVGGRKKLHARWLIYYDFFVRRFLPKIFPFRELDEKFHLIRNQSLSICEIFGRLVYCGYEIADYENKGDHVYFKARKVKDPLPARPKYGVFIKLPRVGRHGKTIHIYKLRSMHAYAQYLHDFVLEGHGFATNGKISNDFRIPDWGRVLRRWWIDEVPQVINLLTGELALIGVRALSQPMYDTYPDDLKTARLRYKPGLIPPFYADMPRSIEDVFASERRYLRMKEAHSVRTDWAYFLKAFVNIVFRGARSS